MKLNQIKVTTFFWQKSACTSGKSARRKFRFAENLHFDMVTEREIAKEITRERKITAKREMI